MHVLFASEWVSHKSLGAQRPCVFWSGVSMGLLQQEPPDKVEEIVWTPDKVSTQSLVLS